jgi:DNA-binding MarR family transcriptional regulator
MNKRQEKVLALLKTAYEKNDASVNAQSISRHMMVSRQLISREILGLEAKGLIVRQPKYRTVDN